MRPAWVKGIIGGVITAATFLAPPVGLIGRIAMAGGQVGLDFILEGPDQSLAKEVGSKTTPIVEQVGDGIADVDKYSRATKVGGRVASVGASALSGYLSYEEITTARANVAEIERMLADTKKAHLRLNKLIKDNKKDFMIFVYKFSKAQEAIENVWRHATDLRFALYEEMKETGYDP